MNPSQVGSSIFVGRVGSVFWLRVVGRGSFQNSVQAKKAFHAVIQEGMHHLVLDLECCTTMDSTFLGMLTGTALHALEVGGSTLAVLNANDRNQQLLNELGLDQILEVDVIGALWPEERRIVCAELRCCQEEGASCKEEQSAHVLQAHQTLSDMNKSNQKRFCDVIHFLEKEISAAPSEGALLSCP